jgi:quinohemoprotein ethanol dehydrogenase
MAYSPRTGLVYLPIYDTAMDLQAAPEAHFIPGTNNQATQGAFPPFSEQRLAGREQAAFEGRLKAWNPVTGKAAWTSEPLPFLNGGTMVAGDLVFQGTATGHLSAYDAATGNRLLNLLLGTVITAAPMTYEIDGVQYIALLAGAGGPQGGFFAPGVIAAERENFQRLIVLKLGGSDIPLPPLRKPLESPPMPAAIVATSAVMARGQELFMDRCSRCHFPGGALGIYPNLWLMPPNIIQGFHAIVADGAMAHGGMGSFSKQLNTSQIDAIKAWIVNDTIARRNSKSMLPAPSSRQTH